MEINPKFLAPCGLYCGFCAVYYATKDKNEKFKERLVGVYKGKLPGADDLSVEGVQCGGCLSDNVFGFCKVCSIKDCTKTKGYQGCHECDDFPCGYFHPVADQAALTPHNTKIYHLHCIKKMGVEK